MSQGRFFHKDTIDVENLRFKNHTDYSSLTTIVINFRFLLNIFKTFLLISGETKKFFYVENFCRRVKILQHIR